MPTANHHHTVKYFLLGTEANASLSGVVFSPICPFSDLISRTADTMMKSIVKTPETGHLKIIHKRKEERGSALKPMGSS